MARGLAYAPADDRGIVKYPALDQNVNDGYRRGDEERGRAERLRTHGR